MEKSLVLASNNKGKLREFQAMFAEFGVDVINQGALGVEACPEPFGTFIENCLAKARHASKMTGTPRHGGRFGRLRQCLERHARRFVGPLCGRAEQ